MKQPDNLPLSGIRVIDFTQVMLGPSATQMLGDYGADVIKVENPKGGELSRKSFGGVDEAALNNPVFCSLNRNKRSLAVDLRTKEGRDVILGLAETADVMVNNFRAGVMEKMGLDYDSVKAINPRIVYASGTGYGPLGPYAHKGGQDVLAQAMSGVMNRRSDISQPITVYPTALCDYTAGMHLVQGVLLALMAREKTGEGRRIDVSLYDSMIAMQMQEAASHMNAGKEINWAEMPLTGVFETSDGALVMVGAFKQNPLRDICSVLGIDDLSMEFPDLQSQRAAKPKLREKFSAVFAQETTAYWIEKLEEKDLLCSPVRSLEETLKDQQTRINGMVVTMEHPVHGAMEVVGSTLHISGIEVSVRRHPPRIGEHNDEILAELAINTPGALASDG
ncbi:MAG: CoA transferase [Chromatocurvus sp.]